MYFNTPNQIEDNAWLAIGSANVTHINASTINNPPAESNNWYIWNRPPGSSIIFILAVGGGSAGETGASGGAGSLGGTGGSSGGISTLLIDSNLLPDTLYISPGRGGLPGATPEAGDTYICTKPATQISLSAASFLNGYLDIVLLARGAHYPVEDNYEVYFNSLGNSTFLSGQRGTAFNSPGFTIDVTPAGRFNTGGGGGGNVLGIGSGITGSGKMPSIPRGDYISTGGYTSIYPLITTGGSGGGGGFNPGNGFAGGPGGLGSGGGGGGAGTVGALGGRGGAGFVYIKCL